jgi:hypothetical protein
VVDVRRNQWAVFGTVEACGTFVHENSFVDEFIINTRKGLCQVEFIPGFAKKF